MQSSPRMRLSSVNPNHIVGGDARGLREVLFHFGLRAGTSIYEEEEATPFRTGSADETSNDVCRSMVAQSNHPADNTRGQRGVGFIVAAKKEAVVARVITVIAQRTTRRRAFFHHVQPMMTGVDAIPDLVGKLADTGEKALGGALTQNLSTVGRETK